MKSTLFTVPKDHITKAIILDLDDTLTLPERDSEGKYIIQENGHIHASLIDKDKIKTFIKLAIENDIPLYIVTARPDTTMGRKLIESLIEEVEGFHAGPGGFNKNDYVRFAGKLDEKLVWHLNTPKAELIELLHNTHFPYLKPEDILFIDDMKSYLEAAAKKGYQTIQADPLTLEHFDMAINFIKQSCAETFTATVTAVSI